MSNRGWLIAVDHVELQAPPGRELQLHWFYGDVVGLRLIEDSAKSESTYPDRIRFRSDRLELRITIVENPIIESVACRAFFEVLSLAEVAEMLDGEGYEYDLFRGLRFTDRHLSLLDPGGNRIILRRHWPAAI